MPKGDTIFALSSGAVPAGIAVIRISGPVAAAAFERFGVAPPGPRRASRRKLVDPKDRRQLDDAIVLWFPGPSSVTGENVAELHLHGGRALVTRVLAILGGIDGCRLAEPGEFTRRAFDNGRLDLVAVEGLADLIASETEAQRRQAGVAASGATSAALDSWRQDAIAALARVEAAIDFTDESDVATDAVGQAESIADELEQEIRAALGDGNRGEIVREGLKVALCGPPNAGKSSLLNALSRRDVAIVTPEPGTTRDVLEVKLDLDGYAVVLFDTAGLRPTESVIEREGIRRAVATARTADLVLWLVDAVEPVVRPDPALAVLDAPIWNVISKADLVCGGRPIGGLAPDTPRFSSRTQAGLETLTARLAAEAKARAGDGAAAIVTRARHRACLEDCVAALGAFRRGRADAIELRAEELRRAVTALGRLTGRVDVEAVLGEIFGAFCIGK